MNFKWAETQFAGNSQSFEINCGQFYKLDLKIKVSVDEAGGEHHSGGNGTGRMVWGMKPRV